MTLIITPQPVPLAQNEQGDIQVTGTRIGLEHIVEDYNKGKSPEEMVLAYPSLKLVDVYAVVGYYIRNKAEVDAYVKEQYRRADEVREHLGLDEAAKTFKKTLLERQVSKQSK